MPKFVPVTNPELARNEQDQVSGMVPGCPTLRMGRNTRLGMTTEMMAEWECSVQQGGSRSPYRPLHSP